VLCLATWRRHRYTQAPLALCRSFYSRLLHRRSPFSWLRRQWPSSVAIWSRCRDVGCDVGHDAAAYNAAACNAAACRRFAMPPLRLYCRPLHCCSLHHSSLAPSSLALLSLACDASAMPLLVAVVCCSSSCSLLDVVVNMSLFYTHVRALALYIYTRVISAILSSFMISFFTF
jgi:hypothetical protein